MMTVNEIRTLLKELNDENVALKRVLTQLHDLSSAKKQERQVRLSALITVCCMCIAHSRGKIHSEGVYIAIYWPTRNNGEATAVRVESKKKSLIFWPKEDKKILIELYKFLQQPKQEVETPVEANAAAE